MQGRGGEEREALCFIAEGGAPLRVTRRDGRLDVTCDARTLLTLRHEPAERRLVLTEVQPDRAPTERALSAAIEAQFGWEPGLPAIALDLSRDEGLADAACRSGLALRTEDGLVARPELVMQRRANWLPDAGAPPYPFDPVMSGGKRHPRRPEKPTGLVYARHIPWLGESISFRALGLDDLPLFHRWMNDPRVDSFWQEAGDTAKHRAYLSGLLADPHMLPLIGSFGQTPFAYFEIYWAKENRIAPFYDAHDYDRGWHVAVGEDAFRGRSYISAWLPSLMHYLFLDDPRTQAIVGEPAASHHQQIRNLEVSGFARLKTFDFPHKRASLVMLLRERFFGDRLWLPAPGTGQAAEA